MVHELFIQFGMRCWSSELKHVSEFYFTGHLFLSVELYFALLLLYNHDPRCSMFTNDVYQLKIGRYFHILFFH